MLVCVCMCVSLCAVRVQGATSVFSHLHYWHHQACGVLVQACDLTHLSNSSSQTANHSGPSPVALSSPWPSPNRPSAEPLGLLRAHECDVSLSTDEEEMSAWFLYVVHTVSTALGDCLGEGTRGKGDVQP